MPSHPLSMKEQRLSFSALARHLARMAPFKVNTGTREHEVYSLRGAPVMSCGGDWGPLQVKGM
jgi:hypothetical protein